MKIALAVLALIAVSAAPPARAESGLDELVDAAAERLQIAEPVAAFKWGTHGDIEDPVRIERELVALRDEAVVRGIDPGYVAIVFGDQINATEAIEYARFAEWKLDPTGLPSAPPDLAASRAAIDLLNTKILSQLSLNRSLLNSADCAGQLAGARSAAIRSRHFDDLYRRALTIATRSYCQVPPGG